jgi:hypothetical protein
VSSSPCAGPRRPSTWSSVPPNWGGTGIDHYQSQCVGVTGERAGSDPDSPTASVEWVKQNLNRVRDSLPNSYCAGPAQQECPHRSACLTCPDFQTTPEFLEVHRRQAATNRRLIAQADAKGQFRLAENLRQVRANLGRIIPVLETMPAPSVGSCLGHECSSGRPQNAIFPTHATFRQGGHLH